MCCSVNFDRKSSDEKGFGDQYSGMHGLKNALFNTKRSVGDENCDNIIY